MSDSEPDVDALAAELDAIVAQLATDRRPYKDQGPDKYHEGPDQGGPGRPGPEPIMLPPEEPGGWSNAAKAVVGVVLIVIAVGLLLVLNHYLLFFPGAPGYP